MGAWLHRIGRAPDPLCPCGETQNAAHLLASGCVGGMKRSWEEAWIDPEFCAEVRVLLLNQGKNEEAED